MIGGIRETWIYGIAQSNRDIRADRKRYGDVDMKSFSILTQVLIITLIISGCGTKATPTVDAVELQSTVVAAALALIAETQAAIPTATHPPPTATVTNTAFPTATLPPLPSLEATFSPIPGGNSGAGDDCINQVLPAVLEGETVKFHIGNSTKVTLTVSVNLLQAGPQSVCGYRGYTLAPQQSLVINDLVEGCYTLWAWNPDPKAYFIVTNGTSCLDNSKNWAFDISTSNIKLRP